MIGVAATLAAIAERTVRARGTGAGRKNSCRATAGGEAKAAERIDTFYRGLREEEAKAIELRRLREGEAQGELDRLREQEEAKSENKC